MSSVTKNTSTAYELLIQHDDFITDALLDNCLILIKTKKVNPNYANFLTNGHREAINGLPRNQLKAKNELPINHMSCFVVLTASVAWGWRSSRSLKSTLCFTARVFTPDSGVKLRTTEVYTGSLEVKMVATKDLDASKHLVHCAGTIVQMTERLEMGEDETCWWVINHRGQNHVLLGPLRFFNHDCKNNAKFVSHSSKKLVPRIKAKVKAGRQVTVFYGRRLPWFSVGPIQIWKTAVVEDGIISESTLETNPQSSSQIENGPDKIGSSAFLK
ncbi:hypothetical protein CU097_011753 [Rhizopus azygosporus]|uniref:SET domain-containing protein n=1 Tax=Rhizopus azygosporus TaxID=86630 RepID=A0A367KAQ0_RHIAZ|nr:hypothetical protein CU097_011753 [Rhizopus azygosporus]